ncbi:uncharacterized protein I303_100276 [Kwoniella dejecticola CBS 10117]|uniref:Zn(2)-C6 fungal-type domain-containing protein n=1 Tax=Kwoniella dejecticola CBS 10117 TaxID=1296121 RepID=A0A1A6AEG9_9TREE|nr:uncharacterized protein I303_00277 [Kwoniella dejecticola CBS 10117]OBR88460.1 hypothetical protein I303_00277 [Kwoniella dejecticola CBS 10117]
MPRIPNEDRVSAGPRKIGSKKVRPCDNCRRQKHSCHISEPGRPCTDCAARNKECTFVAPPLKRHGKTPPKTSSVSGSQQAVAGPSSVPYDPFHSVDTPKSSMTALIRSARLPIIVSDEDDAEGSEEAYYDSLDMEYDDYEESHYLGPSAIAASALAASLLGGAGPGQKFRQVSDGPIPALFVRNPALLYGRLGPPEGTQHMLDACVELIGEEKARELMQHFKETTLKAFPVANRMRLEAIIRREPGSGTYPTTFIAALISHTAYTYRLVDPGIVKTMWMKVLGAFEDDFRLPRLITLQTTMMLLLCVPHENHAQNSITLGRAVGCAYVLGLHVECLKWRLPRWERSLRRRLWWSLIMMDTWRSYVQGRPPYIHPIDHNVSLPKMRDSDWGNDTFDDARQSMLAFIGMARLSLILERITSNFHTLQAAVSPPKEPYRSVLLESIANDLDAFQDWLEPELSLPVDPQVTSKAQGVRSMQVAYLGLKVALVRLTLGEPGETWHNVEGTLRSALKVGTELVEFIECLDAQDKATYWFPYSAFNILNAAALLLRVAVKSGTLFPLINLEAGDVLIRLVTCIRAGYVSSWPTAITAKTHIELLLRSLEGELLLTQSLLAILSDPPSQHHLQNQNQGQGQGQSSDGQQQQIVPADWSLDINNLFAPMTSVDQQLWSSLGWLWDTQTMQS